MKKPLIAIIILLAGASAFAQNTKREGYTRPELRDAITVTPAMLAPVRLTPGDYWFIAKIVDPRTGTFNGGYINFRYSTDNRGYQKYWFKNSIKVKVYNLTGMDYSFIVEDTYSPSTGRIIRSHAEGYYSVMLSWSAPNSSIRINKTADYDWDNGLIYIHYENSPNAPVRKIPMEENTLSQFAIDLFALKCKWLDKAKIYKLHYFNMINEKYEDVYIKRSDTKDKKIVKYETIWHGWGEGGQKIYFVNPPENGAPSGMFKKFIIDPKVDRYTIYELTTKSEATKPVRPFIE